MSTETLRISLVEENKIARQYRVTRDIKTSKWSSNGSLPQTGKLGNWRCIVASKILSKNYRLSHCNDLFTPRITYHVSRILGLQPNVFLCLILSVFLAYNVLSCVCQLCNKEYMMMMMTDKTVCCLNTVSNLQLMDCSHRRHRRDKTVLPCLQ